MKRLILLAVLFYFPYYLFGQNLSLDEILSIRKKNLAEAEEYLSNKGWQFLEAQEPTWDKLGMLTFTYNKSNFDDNAESFFHYYYPVASDATIPGDGTRVSIQIHNETVYNSYVNRIKSWGGELIRSYTEDGNFIKIYQGTTMTYKFIIGTQRNNFSSSDTIYFLSISTNEDYNLN